MIGSVVEVRRAQIRNVTMPRDRRAESRRERLDGCRALARALGGACLSTEYRGACEELRWRCPEGHEWWASANAVRRGRWCPTCRHKNLHAQRKARMIARVRAIAQARGGACLSAAYVNSQTHLRWRCAEGHEWAAQPATIATGRWCPTCADTRLGIDFMRKLARERGGRCLSKEYVNGRVHLLWECCNGHRWQASPGNVHNRGSWCPTCAREQARSDARDRR